MDYINTPAEILKEHQGVTVSMDIIFINKLLFEGEIFWRIRFY